MRRPWALAVVAGLALVACGGDDDGGAVADGASTTTAAPAVDALGEAPTFEACAAELVAALASFDLSGIDVADGLDDAELQLADDRFVALEAAHPALGDQHPCTATVDSATDEQVQGLLAQLDPAIVEILGTPRPQQLDQVEDEIN